MVALERVLHASEKIIVVDVVKKDFVHFMCIYP